MQVSSLVKYAACAAAIAASPFAVAQQARTGTMTDQLTASAYVGASLGRSDYDVACVGTGPCDRDTVGGKIFVGSKLSDAIGLELSYLHLGDVDLGGGGDSRAHGLNLSLIAGVPLSQQFSAYGKVGGTYGWTKVDGPAVLGGGKRDGLGLSYGLGVNYHVTRNVDVRLEWDRNRFDFTRGSEDVDLWTVGVAYRFR